MTAPSLQEERVWRPRQALPTAGHIEELAGARTSVIHTCVPSLFFSSCRDGDPVTAEDDRCYERFAIEEWFEKHPQPQVKSPVTNELMGKRLFSGRRPYSCATRSRALWRAEPDSHIRAHGR